MKKLAIATALGIVCASCAMVGFTPDATSETPNHETKGLLQPIDYTQVIYCDSCGEPYALGKHDASTYHKFDDGTFGYCCEYCDAFFTLDYIDREILRDAWKNLTLPC